MATQSDSGAERIFMTRERQMPPEPSYTKLSLSTVEDAAVPNGFSHRWEARVAREPLDAQQTGLSLFRLRPGKRSPFSHRHRDAEEIYVVIGGSGKLKLDDELIEVRRYDAIRVAPGVA